ncbi:MAG: ATP-binding protein, partial [Gallionellaceae bacterium]|nr:ATP-binding protein [Gallionellaceae bacterium]
ISQVHMHVPEHCLPQLQSLVPKLQGAIEEVRHTSMALRPSILDDLGILATLRWFAREYQASYLGIQIDLFTEACETDIPAVLKVVIFRIVQEALNNIAKHAGATRIQVRLKSAGAGLELEIEDDGVGFDVRAVSGSQDRGGMGLVSMRERAEYSGGRFSLASIEGDGTRIKVVWPLPAGPGPATG